MIAAMRTGLAALVLLAGCGDGDDDAAVSPWLDGPALPEGRLEPGVIGFGDALWVIGGFGRG